ncbi:MAG: CopG family ribbon-helix-helix protein [Geminicoccaceae bacterium]
MAEPARLTSALLARKGQALPTGGFAQAKLALIPSQPTAAKRNRQCCDTLSSSERPAAPVRRSGRRPGAGAGDRVAFTVRLDHERHTRLKILAARRGRSGQEMLLRALDAYLEACAIDCPCLRGATTPKVK